MPHAYLAGGTLHMPGIQLGQRSVGQAIQDGCERNVHPFFLGRKQCAVPP